MMWLIAFAALIFTRTFIRPTDRSSIIKTNYLLPMYHTADLQSEIETADILRVCAKLHINHKLEFTIIIRAWLHCRDRNRFIYGHMMRFYNSIVSLSITILLLTTYSLQRMNSFFQKGFCTQTHETTHCSFNNCFCEKVMKKLIWKWVSIFIFWIKLKFFNLFNRNELQKR